MKRIDEIIKHVKDLEYRIKGDTLELDTVGYQLSILAEMVGDLAVEVKEMKTQGAEIRRSSLKPWATK